MSVADRVAAHLPYLRRFARAVTGSQKSGDAYVKAALQALAAVVSPDSWRAAEQGDVLSPLLVVALVAATLHFSLGGYRGVEAYVGGTGMGPAYGG